MIWVALGAGAVGGIIAIGAANYDDYSRYSAYTAHSRYGDSSVLETINNKEETYKKLTADIKENKEKIKQKLIEKINKIKSDYKKDTLNFDVNSAENISPEKLEKILNDELQKEIDKELINKKAELEQIDKIIAKIDEKILCN